MALTLYTHPLASFCHKVHLALYENDTPFTAHIVDFADPGAARAHMDRWPAGKIPVLHDSDADRTIPETSIIIEYLDTHHPGPLRLLPEDAEAARDVRLWDRFFDLYVSVPMQKIVGERLRPQGAGDPFGVAEARATLDTAYAMIEARLARGPWCMGESFTMTDCSATPALFYATIVHPPADRHAALTAYRDRLLQRPAARRVLAEARPYFVNFPYKDAMPAHYLEPST